MSINDRHFKLLYSWSRESHYRGFISISEAAFEGLICSWSSKIGISQDEALNRIKMDFYTAFALFTKYSGARIIRWLYK